MHLENKAPYARLRIVLSDEAAIGPGKAGLLEAIGETGSIAAAGRKLGMSYKRAWNLVEAMNRDFAGGLVGTSRGGKDFGGAELTATGRNVLEIYRTMEARANKSVEAEIGVLTGLLSRP
ncbi:MAG: LysR family transcriptional regulator [Nitratireductor sp.]|nr:LysR family transcriptional regulator [Nitratireductor sp.]MCB1456772.1 LysR family transcriptional regulator [Nitratireductor sp.]MCB1458815.1 LysR family transcriptional regulator [Nitratireductor sp.]